MTTITLQETAAMKPAFQAPNEALHPRQINFADFNNNPALKTASDALGFAFAGQAAINELRTKPDPEHSPARHARVVTEAITSFSDNAASKLTGAKEALKTELAKVGKELESQANLKPICHHFDAITSTFHNMNDGQRAAALDQLITDADGPSLAALIEAPLFITGLRMEQRDSIKLRLYAKINPVGLALTEQLTKALAKYEDASIANIRGQGLLRAGTDRFANKVNEARAVAAKANVGFSA